MFMGWGFGWGFGLFGLLFCSVFMDEGVLNWTVFLGFIILHSAIFPVMASEVTYLCPHRGRRERERDRGQGWGTRMYECQCKCGLLRSCSILIPFSFLICRVHTGVQAGGGR
ncbi:hypothetical protein BZA05DRAFT_260337 [Tricharina praecox]|uniref:uncharacterized protein n=1 Tax=Tricharina praecox TaxID=43433 RepID=UPI002220093E|nr:uncharacterized protein BZA05DRAFT_260337 [Tricharina praecox]KAI5854223.1 hypothetical protein BZA05DRAFT_260337 [Tricharina praecox]